jgi:DNA-binding response OmpR family regulator
VLDLQRSEADGLDLLQQLRACPDLDNVPVIFLAGCGDDDLRWQAMRAGADWFALRPLGMIDLQKRIQKLVRTGRPRLRAIAGIHRDRRVAVNRLKRTG